MSCSRASAADSAETESFAGYGALGGAAISFGTCRTSHLAAAAIRSWCNPPSGAVLAFFPEDRVDTFGRLLAMAVLRRLLSVM